MARKSRTNPSPAAASASSTKPKRIRRKCSAPGCDNRVVQGGVCVTHGAKRKLCSHPGCSKAVKLAGFCSTHGPARRKCDTPGCARVAVQGGKCLSHGARRRVCCYPTLGKGGGGGERSCTKNAIMGGMCKKHYDRVQEAEGMLEMSLCVPVNNVASSSSASAAMAMATTTMTSFAPTSSLEELNEPVGMSLSDGSVSNDNCGEGSGDLMSLSGSPSWGSAMTSATSGASTVATATSNGSSEVVVAVAAVAAAAAAPPALPPVAPTSSFSGGHKHRRSKIIKPTHQRGLSIFDEMLTVDAIIGSGAEGGQPDTAAAATSPQEPEPAASAPAVAVPVPPLPPVPSVKYPQGKFTKTPTPQVSFADCVSGPGLKAASSAPRANKEESPCTGNASCSCNACRSPTLAIFEQMIQASQKLEKGDLDLAKYAGLSPPKLSPRKTPSLLRDSGKMRDVSYPEATPVQKNVSFLPDEPTSTGSVVRKVSSNNIVGEGSGWEENAPAAAATNGSVMHQDHQQQVHQQDPYSHDYYKSQGGQEAAAPGGGPEGPASHALASMATRDNGAVSRTVSHDVDDGRHHHHYSTYYPHRQNYHHGSAPPPPPQYSHHPSTYRHGGAPPPQPPPHYPQGGYSSEQYPQAPRHPSASAREAPPGPPPYYPPASSSYHQQQAPPPSHHHYHRQNSHEAAFHPPQTPALYDVSTTPPREQQEQPMAVVSSHSTHHHQHHHHCDQHLLPKRRENMEHLFIPKEV